MPVSTPSFFLATCIALASTATVADDRSLEDLLTLSLEELMNLDVQVGARTGDKRLHNHKLPVDIITADALRRSGYGELPKVLNHLVPR